MTKKNMLSFIIAIIASIVAIVGAIDQYIQKNIAEKEAKDNQKKADEFQDKLIVTQDSIITEQRKTNDLAIKLIKANDTIERLQNEVNEKASEIIKSNAELIKFQSETIKTITGVGYGVIKGRLVNNTIEFYIESKTTYPLYDLFIEVIDYSKLKKLPIVETEEYIRCSSADYKSVMYQTGANILSQGTYIDIGHIIDVNELTNGKFYVVKVSYRHAITVQYIYLKEKNLVYQIYYLDPNTREFEFIEELKDSDEQIKILKDNLPIKKQIISRN